MKDLDFDELDRAVSSLMTNVPSDKPSTDEKPEKTLTLDSSTTTPGNATPAPAAPTPAATAPSTPVTTPITPSTPPSTPKPSEPSGTTPVVPSKPSVPSVAARRGRFMDVVHPSSDMKAPEPVKSPVSRQGVTIAPSSTAAVSTPSSSSSTPTPEKSAATTPADHSAPVSEWPDPLDMANFKSDTSGPAPLTTPFLADAKVEKRPLGGMPKEAAPEPDKTPQGQEGLTANDANDQLPAKPTDVIALPEELQGDLVAIESGVSKNTPPSAEPEKTETEESKKPEEAPVEKVAEPAPAKSPMPLPSAPKTPEPATPIEKPGVTSIPQQYREEPSTGDKATGAIYDTADYHQPLAHPAKKKSSWLWVLWIVLILALGAGIGAALFYFKVF